MRRFIPIITMLVAASFAVPTSASAQGRPDRPPAAEKKKDRANGPANAQGRGQAGPPGQARGQGGPPAQARERGNGNGNPAAAARNRGGPPAHARGRRGGPPPDVATFNRNLVSRAAAARGRRNGADRRVEVRHEGDEVRVVRQDGQVLFSLDRRDAERLGYWRVGIAQPFSATARQREDGGIFSRLPDDDVRAEGDAPAFCRSGEGHPVWGREWCVDKGFGLGNDGGLWGRAEDIDDVIFRRPRADRDQLDTETLADVLGDIVFGRLALQSLVIGADEPLAGRWIGQPDGPTVLRVTAGDLPVAELVDRDRDEDVDVILVNLGG